MVGLNQEEGRYRVLLIGIGDNTEEEKSPFCHNLSKTFSIPFLLLKKIVDRCPIILKKNLSLKKAEILAKTLKSFGATVSVEERRNFLPISLEFQELVPHQLALESSYLRKRQRGTWSVTGRVENISDETLNDIWALIQLFGDLEEFITFEETPLPINPLPAGETSPFKVVFEGDIFIKRISVAFKNSSGQPIPAVDKRKKREWVEVEIEDEDERSPFSAEPESPFLHVEENSEEKGKDGEGAAEEPLSLNLEETSAEATFEPSEKVLELPSGVPMEKGYQGGEELEKAVEDETIQGFIPTVSDELEEEAEEEKTKEKEEEKTALDDLELDSDKEEVAEASRLEASVFEEATQLLEDISGTTGEAEGEEKAEQRKEEVTKEEIIEEGGLPSFSWIEYFREAVETYYQRPRDIFSMWFGECRKEGEFKNSIHALLTILVHSRFDQEHQSIKALENTQRVFRLIVQPNLLLDDLPPFERTPFVSGEVWRDLFHRALPKVQQIGKVILEKNYWNAFDLEQLIQVIPHMGHQNSRIAIRWINELIPDVVEVDFSDTPIIIGEGIYRVASRLGIVDPHFDTYQGRNSMGDIKIQSFAKEAFPQNPVKVEEPMAWMGREEERGGHCFPIQPQCEGCLFEVFCSRLYVHFNPSEKGMRE
jgi:hypothetical protein